MITTDINIPGDVQMILGRLQEHGHKAYVVGGCVRDSLAGFSPHDWDICTGATPDQVKKAFPKTHLVDTGLKHGTVTVVVHHTPYEITTFRVESEYSDHRHPDSVSFTDSLTQDLSRRDFTINAMAYNKEEGLIDPFHGRRDLCEGIIRCVGNPDARFEEDPLRILRAVRFESVFGLYPDIRTSLAIFNHRSLLKNISAERVRSELCKILMGRHVLGALMNFVPIICEVVPEMGPCVLFDQRNKWHQYDVYEHIARAVNAYRGGDLTVRLALFFHDIGKPSCFFENETGGHFYGHPEISAKITNEIMIRLKFDNKTRRDVVELVREHDRTFSPTAKAARKLLSQLGETQARRLLEIRRADVIGQRSDASRDRLDELKNFTMMLNDVLNHHDCFSLKDLAVNGNDLKKLGFTGKEIGYELNYLLDLVISGIVSNTKEELLEKSNGRKHEKEIFG